MSKDLKPKSVSNEQPDGNKVGKELKPKNDSKNHKDLNQNTSDYDPNKSIDESTDNLQNGQGVDAQSVQPNGQSSGASDVNQGVGSEDGSYMDGFDDDASGWMADKLEAGLGSAKDKIADKFLGGNDANEIESSDPSADGGETSDPESSSGETSEVSSDGAEISEVEGNGEGSDPEKENGSVDSQNSSSEGDFGDIGSDLTGDGESDDGGDSSSVMDKATNFLKGSILKNKGVKLAIHSFNFVSGLLTSAGVPAFAVLPIILAVSAVTVTAVGVTGAVVVASNNAVKDEKVVKLEDCSDEERAAQKAKTLAGDEGANTAEQEENVKKIHSALKEWGLNDIQISGVVGNGEQESGLSPKKFESDHVAGGKYKTEENYEKTRKDGPIIEYIFGSWSTFLGYYNGSLNESGYKEGAPSGQHTLGVGVWQWTGGGAMGLYHFSKEKSLDMWSIDAQLTYMLSSFSNKSSYYHRLETFKGMNSSNPEQAAVDFLNKWEYEAGNFTPNDGTHAHAENRAQYAAKWYVKIKEMQVDKTYAKSILDAVVRNAESASNDKVASTQKSLEDCDPDTESYGGSGWQKKGGKFSGADSGGSWTKEELPDELKQYAIDPRSVGMKFGSREGWTLGGDGYVNAGYCNQCTSLSSSLIGVLWEKDGQPIGSKHGMHGDGKAIVSSMASALGVKVRNEPISGDVFSQGPTATNAYGHTGVVSHVFENGDILIVEQNWDKSGGARSKRWFDTGVNDFEWSYRYIKKSEYSSGYTFASPEKAGYKISSKAKSMK